VGSVSISAMVTNCSSLKSVAPDPGLAVGTIVPGPQVAVAEQWLKRVAAVSPTCRASDLYSGRGVKRLKRVAERLSVPIFIASAGLGLLRGGTKVPSYDLSVSLVAPVAVQRRVVAGFSAHDWWASVQQTTYATPFTEVFAGVTKGLVLVAVSSAYVPLLTQDLTRLEAEQRARLRLFGASDSKYPSELRPMLMPYDARLDRLVRGSKVDFAQRAAEHFASGCEAGVGFPTTLEAQRHWVEGELNRVVTRPGPKRRSVDDEEIRRLASRFAKEGVRQTRALALLRREEGIACEQSRFRRLFLEVSR
jgi:hypothetical protein